MRQAGVIRYLAMVTFLVLPVACGTMPGMRTSMPPVPAEAPPGTVAQPPAPDLAQQVQNLQSQIQQLESRVAQLEGHPAGPATAKPHAIPAPSTSAYPKATAKTPISNGGAEKYYTEGMQAYHAKKYGEARTKFNNYLRVQPKGPRAPEARYYLADSFYLESKYKEAAVEFNKLRVQFPKSILAPAGLLRLALCYKSQKQTVNYRSTLNKLIKAYPNTPEAKEAQKMLKEGSKAASR